jgi:dihydroorotate dehydrogenase (NAD+) catalytic subunit
VQVGTATFNDPTAPVRVLRELTELLEAKGYERFADVVGAAHPATLPRRPRPLDAESRA